MLIFDERLEIKPQASLPNPLDLWDNLADRYGGEKVVMFDLETTGFSPKNAFIYIIGINLKKEDGWHILQLFNDDGKSEPEMLQYFMELLKDKTAIFHFNGSSFDIPFVRGRMEKIRQALGITIEDHLSNLTSYDFYTEISPFKYALGLPNVKQKTVELYLGLYRTDQYNGGQLIEVYLSFLSGGSLRNRDLVLLHNRDDMEGMFHLARLHSLAELYSGAFTLGPLSMEQQNECLFLSTELTLDAPVPVPLTVTGRGALLTGKERALTLRLPLTSGTLTCRITKEEQSGFFLPDMDYTGAVHFGIPSEKKVDYISANDELLGNPDRLKAYITCCVQKLMKQRGKC